MTYVITSLVVVWVCGLVILAGLLLNDARVIYNNLIPGAQPEVGRPSHSNGLRWWHAIWWLPMGAADIVLLPLILLFHRVFEIDRFSYRFSSIDPVSLNETGLAQLRSAIRRGWFIVVWAAVGFVLIAWGSSYSAAL